MAVLQVKRLHRDAIIPTKAHAGDLGYDFYALEETVISPDTSGRIRTGISCQFPRGYGGLIRDRSSIATELSLFVVAGVIDSGYTGEIQIVMRVHSKHPDPPAICIPAGTKIAQMILIPTVDFPVKEVGILYAADTRADAGFGSSD